MAKRKSTLTKKSSLGDPQSYTDAIHEETSNELNLSTAPGNFTGAAGSRHEAIKEAPNTTNDESATFDIVQTQLDQQLQHELNSFIEEQHKVVKPTEEAQMSEHPSLPQNLLPIHRSSIFDLPRDDEGGLKKRTKKQKLRTDDENIVLSSKLQKANKKRRKTKASEQEHEEN